MPTAAAIGATLACLAAGFWLKAPCASHAWGGGFEYRRLCYNDLQPLYYARGIADGKLPYRDVDVEYPVVTGTFAWAAGRLERALGGAGDGDYFRLSALLLAPFALAITLALRRRVAAARLLWWALGPPLLLYAFANWDLLAVAGAAGGLIALDEDRPALAGGALAFGASAKLFPLFFLPSAVASRWAAGDRRGAARVAIAFAAVACALNLPWLAISARGWLATWRFHARRYPDFGTLWYWIGRAGAALHPSPYWEPGQSGFRELAGALGLALFAAAAAWLVARGWRRKLPVAATALAVLCAFLLAATVHSPQYALWLLPVVVLADVPDPLIVGWLAADVVLFVSGLRWAGDTNAPGSPWRAVFAAAVFARALALAALAWWPMRARRSA